MSQTKTTTTERYEICSLCGGRGQEYSGVMTTVGALMQTCRQCNGSGRRLVETTTTTETIE